MRHAQRRQSLGHPVHALAPLPSLLAAEFLEPRRLPVHEVAEDVDLGALDVAVDLDARQNFERPVRFRRGHAPRQAPRSSRDR